MLYPIAFPLVSCYFYGAKSYISHGRIIRMNPELQITILEKPDDSAWEVIGGGISNFNLSHAGSDAATPLCIVLRDEAGSDPRRAHRRYLLRLALRQPHVPPRGPARAGLRRKAAPPRGGGSPQAAA